MDDTEAIEMMRRCSEEIKSLQRQNERLAPEAEAFRVISRIIGMIPGPSQGYSEDMLWRLDKRIAELELATKSQNQSNKVTEDCE